MDVLVKKTGGFVTEFKEFAMKGNMIDLAVGVVIGTAFNAVVTSLVNDIIMQGVAWAFGQPNFNAIVIGPIHIGNFITALVNFLIIALSVFVTIKIMMKWMPKKKEVLVVEEAK
ncbi:MAG: mechanosensitive ion channel protein MscL [Patescibacteria group bacterium]|nr:mechanosensitive ion channel protein MscL [Patescibacteria group bacterium]